MLDVAVLLRLAAPRHPVAPVSIDIAALIAANFARFGGPVGVQSAVLTKITPGIRMPGAATSGTNPTARDFAADGIVADFTAYELQSTLIKAGDRKVLLFGASIEGGAVPEPNDRIAIGGETLVIVGPVGRDPALAVYTCQCRA